VHGTWLRGYPDVPRADLLSLTLVSGGNDLFRLIFAGAEPYASGKPSKEDDNGGI
jgi:hypothetical protein